MLFKSSPTTYLWSRRGERKYSSSSFTTRALDGVSGQRHALAALCPRGKNPRYPLDRRLGGPQSQPGHTSWRKNPFVSSGDQSSIAQWPDTIPPELPRLLLLFTLDRIQRISGFKKKHHITL
jgi:hypothetical protein